MIGVLADVQPSWAIEEFFEFFKTPWERWQRGRSYDLVVASGVDAPLDAGSLILVMGAHSLAVDEELEFEVTAIPETTDPVLVDGHTPIPLYGSVASVSGADSGELLVTGREHVLGIRKTLRNGTRTVIRLGYDLFAELRHLLSEGQPLAHAGTPTLDLHIARLRMWLQAAGVSFVEIPPVPFGHHFFVTLTHDIDFIGIRPHFFDHTMFGFLYRATLGSFKDFARGHLSWQRFSRNVWAAAKLPLVYLGLANDFWMPFPWLLEVESGLPATYYLVPFKRRPGRNVKAAHPARRATAYDVGDMQQWTLDLRRAGCEIGVHGIDAWHDPVAGKEERQRIESVSQGPVTGVRIHWLQFDENSHRVLEQAGYSYDTTIGYNETVGYRCGTGQVFRPSGVNRLLVLPLHIQDGALFFQSRLHLSEQEAQCKCERMIENCMQFGGVLTVLWHDRSHAPDRQWGDFYRALLASLKAHRPWFATADDVVQWFRRRRDLRFVERDGQVAVEAPAALPVAPFLLRRHSGSAFSDYPLSSAIASAESQPSRAGGA